MDRKLAFEVTIAELTESNSAARAMRLLGLLAPVAVSGGELAALGTQVFVDGRVRAALVDLLEQPTDGFIEALNGAVGSEPGLSKADLRAGIARIGPEVLGALRSAPSISAVRAAQRTGPVPAMANGAASNDTPSLHGSAAGDRSAAGGARGAGAAGKAHHRPARETLFPSGTRLTFEPTKLPSARVDPVRRWIAESPSRGTCVLDWSAGRDYLIWDYNGKHLSPTKLTETIVDMAITKGSLGSFRVPGDRAVDAGPGGVDVAGDGNR